MSVCINLMTPANDYICQRFPAKHKEMHLESLFFLNQRASKQIDDT